MITQVMKGKNRQQVLKMIRTGEVHQYYASPDEICRAVAKGLKCPKWIARKIIRRADERRANAFAEALGRCDLPSTVARWCS